jgi:hypothetical protein
MHYWAETKFTVLNEKKGCLASLHLKNISYKKLKVLKIQLKI